MARVSKADLLRALAIEGPKVSKLRPLFEALTRVLAQSGLLADCYREVCRLRAESGAPRPEHWPDSPELEKLRSLAESDECFVEPRWTSAIRDFEQAYPEWVQAIKDARAAVDAADVAQIMDAGEARPVSRWTKGARDDLDDLRRTFDPMTTGGPNGRGFIEHGEPDVPKQFFDALAAVHQRHEDLRNVAPEPPGPRPPMSVDDARRKAEDIVKAQGFPVSRGKPSTTALARRVGCSHATMKEAIDESRKLQRARDSASGAAGPQAELGRLIEEQARDDASNRA